MDNLCFTLLCRFNNQMVLQTSKANVAKHYAVVGVLEMWDETLEVMENTLPFFFSGKCMRYLNIRVSALSKLI